MSSIRKVSPAIIAILALIFSVSTASFAKSKNDKFPNIKIKNFGQMDDRFFRGSRPDEGDYQALAALGVKTIIDLTDNSMEYEKPAVEAAGLRYVNIPMVDKSYPSMDQINAFLKVVDDPATGKFFVHCAGGRHRTGVVGAVYRFNNYHWNLDQVYQEMLDFDFYTSNGHGGQKKFVENYAERMLNNAPAAATTSQKK